MNIDHCELIAYTNPMYREGIRLAILQSRGEQEAQFRKIIHLSLFPCLIVCFVSMGVLHWYSHNRQHVDIHVVWMYCLGAFLELIAEPFYNLYYCRLLMLPRLRAEMAAVVCRSLVTFFLVVTAGMGIKGFGGAQVAYGLVYLLVMAAHVNMVQLDSRPASIRDIMSSLSPYGFLQLLRTSDGVPDELLVLAVHTTGSSLLKHILTEGDKIVLSLNSSHFNQGIYAIASNYGSLVARIILQPIEESCRVAFSRMYAAGGDSLSCSVARFSVFKMKEKAAYNSNSAICGDDDDENIAINGITTRSRSKRHIKPTAPSQEASQAGPLESVSSMVDLLINVLRGTILFSLIFPVFGAYYSRVIVKLFLGSSWYSDETVNTLAAYCFYILAISINGLSESFVHSVISPTSLYSFNIALILSWIVFISMSFQLMGFYGTPGLVMANILGMAVRSVFNLYFVHSFSKYVYSCFRGFSHDMKSNIYLQMMPPIKILVGCVFFSIFCWVSAHRFTNTQMQLLDYVTHVSVGVVCGILYLVSVWFYCREDVLNIYQAIRTKGKRQKAE